MPLPTAIIEFLKQKRSEVCESISRRTNVSDFDENFVETLMSRGDFTAPSLDIQNRSFRSVMEVPPHDYPAMHVPHGVTVGLPYQGIEVTIPVLNDIGLLKMFVAGRHICPGLFFRGNSLEIKQYDLNEIGIDALKQGIKACVDQLSVDLGEFESDLERHRAILEMDIRKGMQKRREELLAKEEKDRNSDPWA